MRAEPAASTRLRAERPVDVGLPQPAIAEVAYGLSRLPTSRRKRELSVRFEVLLGGLARVEWTDDVSRAFGAIKSDLERRGERVDDFDVAIAAHAVAYESTVVTRNVRHFDRIRGLCVDAWAG